MSDIAGGLQITGGITTALLDALDQIHSSIAAQLTNPDGSPSGTAVYMHLPIGRSIDPKMYANPWTPAGMAYQATGNDGQFAAPDPAPAPAAGAATPAPPAQQVSAAQQTGQTSSAINSAMNTSRLVDDMLMVTDKGVATSWPDRRVSIEYFTVLEGMQALPIPDPPADVVARIAAAEKVLYTMDAEGNYTGYTPLYQSYRHNLKAVGDARTAYANGYAAAMGSPAAGAAWPVASASLQASVDEAWNDFRNMGAQKVEDAQNTLQSVGGSAVAALIAKARRMYDDYQVGIAGAIAEKVPWSGIDPVSWWDHNDSDFGVLKITASSDSYTARGGSGSHAYSNSFAHASSSSNSGGIGLSLGGFGGSVDVSHSQSDTDASQHADQSGWQHFQDVSTSASVSFEYFVAECFRDWALLDLLHIEGWYLAGQKQNAISDGSITGQIDAPDRILPMVPKAFVVVRNLTITADNWGDMGNAFQSAVSNATQHTDSSSTSIGGSAGWCGIGGHFQHSDSNSNSAFTNQADSSNTWDFQHTDQGGTLQLLGSQIVGWIGQIQPASPAIDDPGLGKKTDAAPASGTSTDASAPAGTAAPAGTPAASTTGDASAPATPTPTPTPTPAGAPS